MKKILYSIGLGTILSLVITWCVWTTNGIYQASALQDKVIQYRISEREDIEKIYSVLRKIDNKIDNTRKSLDQKMDKHQQQIIQILIDLQRR